MENVKYIELSNYIEYLCDVYDSWRDVDDEERLEVYEKYSQTDEGIIDFQKAFNIPQSKLLIQDLYSAMMKENLTNNSEVKEDLKLEIRELYLQILDPLLFIDMETEFNEKKDYLADQEQLESDFMKWQADDVADRMSNFNLW